MQKQKTFFMITMILMSLIVLSGCALMGQGGQTGKKAQDKPLSKDEFMLDTAINISIYDWKDKSIFDTAFEEIKRLEGILSVDQAGSDLEKLFQSNGAWTQVSPETIEVFLKSKEYSQKTNGYFDVTAGPLISLWSIKGGSGHYPAAQELQEVLPLTDYSKVEVSKDDGFHQMRVTLPGMKLNYGAIAKGYIGDQVKELMVNNGVKSAVINLGGNILTIGHKPDGSPFLVGIQDPLGETGAYLGVVKSADHSLVSSGDYERFFIHEGKKYHHILNPKTGFSADNELCGVTVITKESVDGDALSTSIFLMGLSEGKKLIEQTSGAEAIFITKDKKIYLTSGIIQDFELMNHEYQLVGGSEHID